MAEEYTWAEIKLISESGKAHEYFALGDTKTFKTTNGIEVVMEIVAFNADVKADGTGVANITWIAKNIVDTHVMNTTMNNANGWKASAMRTWIQNDFYNSVPGDVKNAIVPVNKTYVDYTTQSTLSCIDTLWIPSQREICGSQSSVAGMMYESNGVDYLSYFSTPASRMKYDNNGAATVWFLRSADTTAPYGFHAVMPMAMMGGGFSSFAYANNVYGVVIGFCT